MLVQLRDVREERVGRPLEEAVVVERVVVVAGARGLPVLPVDRAREALQAVLDRGARLELLEEAVEDSAAAGGPAGDKIDLYERASRQSRNADAGPRRTPRRREVPAVHRVHALVVLLEPSQENPRRDDLFQTEAAACEHTPQVLHHLACLSFDALRDRARCSKCLKTASDR